MKQAEFFYNNPKAPKPNKPNLVGATILIEYQDMLLLEHRVDSERWAIIGGSLKNDISYPDGNIFRSITIVYRVKLTEEPKLVCSEESKELKFFTKEELKSVKIVETHIPILQDYLHK